MKIIRRYVVDAVVAIGMLALLTAVAGLKVRADGCSGGSCQKDSDCTPNPGCACQFDVDGINGICVGGGN